jgi:hypothetical protein
MLEPWRTRILGAWTESARMVATAAQTVIDVARGLLDTVWGASTDTEHSAQSTDDRKTSAAGSPPGRPHRSSALALEVDATAGDSAVERPAGRRATGAPLAGNVSEAAVSPPLPRPPDHDRLVALSRDPESAFVFWEVQSSTRERVLAAMELPVGALARDRLQARVVSAEDRPDLAGRSLPSQDLPPGAESRYVEGLPPGAEIEITIGLAWRDRFAPLAPSARVRTPAPFVSKNEDVHWRMLGGGKVSAEAPSPLGPPGVTRVDCGSRGDFWFGGFPAGGLPPGSATGHPERR